MLPPAHWGKRVGFVVVGFLLGAAVDSPLTAVLGATLGWLLARDREQAALADWLSARLAERDLQLGASKFGVTTSTAAPEATTSTTTTTTSTPTDTALTPTATPTPTEHALRSDEPVAPQARPAMAASEPAPWPTREPVPALPPRPPGPISRGFAAVQRYFTTGNVVAKVGVLVLFLGVAFLVNYAIDNALLPPQLRLAGASLLGAALLVLGYRLRHRSDAYGLLLQGAGIGVLYLTVFAALQLYELLPPFAALVLLLALVAAGAVLALRQNSELLAAFASVGGFAAPLLVSSGSGNYVGLFGFYLLLDLGILAMAWFRAWRIVNLLAFVFTFGIGTLWGLDAYAPERYLGTQVFLAVFFLHFVVVALLFARSARRVAEEPESAATDVSASADDSPFRGALVPAAVNGTLVFGVPIVVFGLQSQLVDDQRYGLALSALAMAVVYLAASAVVRRWRAVPPLLGDAFIALTLIFASLAIPLAVTDQRLTGAAWAIEGAGLIWLGFRQQRRYMRVFGLLLQIASGGALLFARFGFIGAVDYAGFGLSCALAAVAIWFASWLYARHAGATSASIGELQGPRQGWTALWLVVWGGVWWAVALGHWIGAFVVSWHPYTVAVAAGAASFLALAWVGARSRWDAALGAGLAALPCYGLALFVAWAGRLDLAQGVETLCWLFATAALWGVLWLRGAQDDDELSGHWHLATLLIATVALASIAAAWAGRVIQPGGGWALAAPGVVGALVLAVLARPQLRQRWPLAAFPSQYGHLGVLALCGLAVAWLVVVGWQPALATPLPTLPLLNPLELVQLGLLLLVIARLRSLAPQLLGWVAGGAALVFVTQAALRASHVLAAVPYDASAFAGSAVTQATLSLVWALCAVVTMFFAARRAVRAAWLAGAVLLGVVVVKLLLVDQAGVGAIARIVSFIGVGGLMLTIGYLAPLPPAREPAAEAAT